jgi:putative integral membrane protein (TIGR02587 family)
MREETRREWEEEGTRLLRGMAGGLIIGIPLLYTMEVWWIGMYVSDWRLIGFLAVTLLINAGLNHASGFSEEHDIWSDIRNSVTALGISTLISALVLLLISAIPHGFSLSATIGKIALGAIPVSIGFSVANTQFAGRSGRGEEQASEQQGGDDERQRARVDLLDIGITIAGAAVFVFAVAPTEEIIKITARTTGFHWAALVLFTLALTYGMVFVADFAGSQERQFRGLLQHPIPETLLAYTFSVGVGLLLLFFFGRDEVFMSVSNVVGHATVIGLPAAVGGAAGRIIV